MGAVSDTESDDDEIDGEKKTKKSKQVYMKMPTLNLAEQDDVTDFTSVDLSAEDCEEDADEEENLAIIEDGAESEDY